MASTLLSQNDISNGRRNILQSLPNPTPYATPTTYTRPSDWTALPTVGSTYYATGIYAVYNQDSNFVALNCTTSSGNYQVDWGDGTVDIVASGSQAQHNYVYSSVPGVVCSRGYKTAAVTITAVSGTLATANFNVKYTAGTGQGTINAYISKWLDMRINCSMVGSGSINFTLSGANAPLNMLEQVQVDIIGTSLSTAQALDSKFSGLKSLQSFILNSSMVIASFTSAFSNTAFVSAPSLSNTNTGTNTNMAAMFQNCFNLTYCPDYYIPSCTAINSMFVGCNVLEVAPTLTTTSALLNTVSMFQNCVSLRNVPLFNTSGVTNMSSMFSGCTSLRTEGLPLFNTVNCANMLSTFNSCSSLITIPLFNTSNVTTMGSTFQGCTALENVPLFNTINVTVMGQMFQSCTSLHTIPLLNTSNVTQTNGMFASTTSLITIPILNTSNITSMTSMFEQSGVQYLPNIDTSNVTTMGNLCNGAFNLTTIPSFNTTKVANMSQLVSNSSVVTIPLIDTSNATAMVGTFANSKIQSVPALNTSNVTSMTNMFLGANALSTGPSFTDTSKVTNMTSMFQGCSRLSSVPSYNYINCTTYVNMFNSATNLVSFTGSNIGSTSTANYSGMFTSCTSLNNIANINAGNITVVANTITFPSLSSFSSTSNVTNCKFTMSLSTDNMGRTELENVFNNVIINNPGAVQTITISSNPGADTANAKTGGLTANSNVITMANTLGVLAGQYVYGTGVGTGIPVTFTDATDLVQYTNALTNTPIANNTLINFTAITTTTGISINTTYYAVNAATSGFQVASTQGGAARPLTLNGTGVMSIGAPTGNSLPVVITAVNTNANIVMSGVMSLTNAAASLTIRNLNTTVASGKAWTVTG